MKNEYPELVIVLTTWEGPSEKNQGEAKLKYAKEMKESIKKHLSYPNYTWHIADDGSKKGYQEEFLSLFDGEEYTFSDTEAQGDFGKNLNIGMRTALRRSDFVLHWNDDYVLESKIDICPYVNLLQKHDDIGIVRLRPSNTGFKTTPFEMDGRSWMHVGHTSPGPVLVDTGKVIMHRRFWDYYGPYPETMRVDIVEYEMTWRVHHFAPGPKIVIPKEFCDVKKSFAEALHRGTLDAGTSAWEWRIHDKGEKDDPLFYRSYGMRFKETR